MFYFRIKCFELRNDSFVIVPIEVFSHHEFVYYGFPKILIEFQVHILDALNHYFRLDICENSLHSSWTKRFENVKSLGSSSPSKYLGLRLLRQEPLETIFSFICSQNNKIQRITQMCAFLRSNFGSPCWRLENGLELYAFPTLQQLHTPRLEEVLREKKFGYRAKYISEAVKFLVQADYDWNSILRLDVIEARKLLEEIPGVGRKVADCICLMALDKTDVVPVDTHMLKVYLKCGRSTIRKSGLSSKDADAIQDFFRDLFGTHAGWAHLYLFADSIRPKNKNG